MLSWFRRRHADQTVDRVVAAYPPELGEDVRQALRVVPVGRLDLHVDSLRVRVSDDLAIEMPSRVYFEVPGHGPLASLPDTQRAILYALFTRHHDGYVRERFLREILGRGERWLVPFLVDRLGEYVVEITMLLQRYANHLDQEAVRAFLTLNPKYRNALCQRVFSYWQCRGPKTRSPAYEILMEIGAWDTSVARRRINHTDRRLI